jgi:hypothetical protein
MGARVLLRFIAVTCLVAGRLPADPASVVSIRPDSYEDRPQFRVTTTNATWFYDRAGGGFSRLLDREGRDWISFHKDPLSQMPASAAAGFRGLPNSVFGGPDSGAGHPGFDRMTTEQSAPNQLRSTSRSGDWAWTWTFHGEVARFRMERAPTNTTWWFLYEGTIGGQFAPNDAVWATDRGAMGAPVPTIREQRFDQWRWIWFGDRAVPRVLWLAQVRPDALEETLWFMGSGAGAAVDSPDGMVVFGFGRGPKTKGLLMGAGHEFLVGLRETARGPSESAAELAPFIEAELLAAQTDVRHLRPTRKPNLGELHFGSLAGGTEPLKGEMFAAEFLPIGSQLVRIEVAEKAGRPALIAGLRFTVKHSDGAERVQVLGLASGAWRPAWQVPAGATVTGFSAAGGWMVDSLKFHFSDGSETPRHGGAGGDFEQRCEITRRDGRWTGRLCGLWGSTSNGALESIGLLTMPEE